MSDILCVTNRKLCEGDFLQRIEAIAKAPKKPQAMILREKDLSEEAYFLLAQKVIAICNAQSVEVILHSFVGVAMKLNHTAIHLPIPVLKGLSEKERRTFSVLGASCHSVEEAVLAEKLGCTYLVAGHIFETDCKRGIAGRGLVFLKEVCDSVQIPVYGIGGVNEKNLPMLVRAGAKGGCMMSGFMKTGSEQL